MTGPAMIADASSLAARAAAGASMLLTEAVRQQWRGPDPYDGLFFPWPGWMTSTSRRRQVIVQAHARSPMDVRRLYRRSHPRIAKTLGVFGSVAMRLARGGCPDAAGLGSGALGLLDADHSAGDAAWGYPFDVQTRWSFYPAGSPNVVVTSFAVRGLLEGAAFLDRPQFRGRAAAAARWVLDELWVEKGEFFAYHPTADVNIHNANLLGALCVYQTLADDAVARDRVRRAVRSTLAAQSRDGGFPYGAGPGLEWRDSFHTGFVLCCLMEMSELDPVIDDAVRRGAASYLSFFDDHGRARLFAERAFPEDAHSAGTGLSTLAMLSGRGAIAPTVLMRVAERTVSAGLRGAHAVARRYRWGATTPRYIRWCDAHVALGLADASLALSR